MGGILAKTFVNAVALFIAGLVIPGISWGHHAYGQGSNDVYISLALTGLVLGLVNAFIRPIVKIFTLPLNLLTFGMFSFVLNAIFLILISTSISFLGFSIDNFFSAFLAALIIGFVSGILSSVIKS